MHLPKVIFRPMTLEENIDIIKWSFFETNTNLSVRDYTLSYFKELKEINMSLPKSIIEDKISKAVTKKYQKDIKKLQQEATSYNSYWQVYNNLYFQTLSDYLHISWPKDIAQIDASIGFIPVFPRYLDTHSFSVGTGLKSKELIKITAHETLHFLWFHKWHKLYPKCPKEHFDSPYLPWVYSEMVTDPILNSSKLSAVYSFEEKAYDSFYSLKYDNKLLMQELQEVYQKKLSIEEKIMQGYNYLLKAYPIAITEKENNMNNKEILKHIKEMTNQERRNLTYDELVTIMTKLSADEIIELSNIIGYPVFTRLCMNGLKHKFVLLQDGAAAIILNEKNQVLLQRRADRDVWGLPGGCQELGERFQDTIIREVKEETNLDVLEEDLKLIDIVSGSTRRNSYPNGDVVINNTALYCIKKYTGEIKWDSESKEMMFFDFSNLPNNQNDPDLLDIFLKKQ